MKHLTRQHQELEKLIVFQIAERLNSNQQLDLFKAIKGFLADPQVNDYTLELIATRIARLGVDYEYYVSVLIFKALPDQFTKKELVVLEDELYSYIEKELYGKGLDQRISQKLEEQIVKQSPELSETMARKKAMGHWGWLLPHALIQLIIDKVLYLINDAINEANKVNRKGRGIRIKKMD